MDPYPTIIIHRLHAVATHNTEEFIYDHVDGHLRELGLPPEANARELVDAVMGYTGRGYAHSTQEELGRVVNSNCKLQ